MLARVTMCVASVVFGSLSWQMRLGAQTVDTATLVVQASFAPRTSLQVSTSRLRFDVAANGAVARATADYRAAARTAAGQHVLLTVESAGALEAADGSDTAELVVLCGGETGELQLTGGRPRAVVRWREGGVRRGTVNCRLDGAAGPGSYSLPVKFVVVLE